MKRINSEKTETSKNTCDVNINETFESTALILRILPRFGQVNPSAIIQSGDGLSSNVSQYKISRTSAESGRWVLLSRVHTAATRKGFILSGEFQISRQ